MRSKQAFKNVISSIALQLIIVITGIYIPQLMITTYGSEINGMVSSITQFITYLSLVEAGIGNASIVALYGPLATKNQDGINGVLAAAKKFYSYNITFGTCNYISNDFRKRNRSCAVKMDGLGFGKQCFD